MDAKVWLKEAEALKTRLIQDRRYLHGHAEVGFALQRTLAFVKRRLQESGYTPKPCGRAGLTAVVGGGERTVLLRADMDALPLRERTNEPFKSTNGNMHACGHDMHAAMLLGAATLLKRREKALNGRVKLVFQPAEEILAGAKDMLKAGVLNEPTPQAAIMLHATTGVAVPTGTTFVPEAEICAPAADRFTVKVRGTGGHGSSPSDGVDALHAAAQILLALEEIPAREISLTSPAVLTVGKLTGGEAANAIAAEAELSGTLRCYDEDLRLRLKKRVREIAQGVAASFRAQASVRFTGGCPSFLNDLSLAAFCKRSAEELLGKDAVVASTQGSGASEDFAYISRVIPTTTLAVAAGSPKDGHAQPLHRSQTTFDENALPVGAALYAYLAAKRI